MKVERKGSKEKCPTCGGPGFQPVVIELETQDEVDQMYSIFNFYQITELNEFTQFIYNKFRRYRSDNYRKHFDKVYNAIRK